MSRTIASRPPWTASSITNGSTATGEGAMLPDAHPTARAVGRLAPRLEDAVLVVAAGFVFPVVILLVFSPFALAIAAIVSGLQRLF